MSFNAIDGWEKCAEWFFKVLPKEMRSRTLKSKLKDEEFKNSLRSGEFLCKLVDKLKPGCINEAETVKIGCKNQTASRANINLFLKALLNDFELCKRDLFHPDLLYNMEYEFVLETLAKLSKTEVAKKDVVNNSIVSFDVDENNERNKIRNGSLHHKIENENKFKKSNWYCNFDRKKAELILYYIPIPPGKSAVFLVRPSSKDCYAAISIKYNGSVDHLKIYNIDNDDKKCYYIHREDSFQSICELVQYYMRNTLEVRFPKLKTTLGIPFKDLLPHWLIIGKFEIENIFKKYNWYCNVNREKAEILLDYISIPPGKSAVFMVRPSTEGGYAISIKYNGSVDHLKIETIYDDDKKCYYLQPGHIFQSISELVQHYMCKTLEIGFPKLKTTLGVPFKEVLIRSINKIEDTKRQFVIENIFKKHNWYCNVDDHYAEEILKHISIPPQKTTVFLVRPSSRLKHGYKISIKYGCKILHLKISNNDDKKYYLEDGIVRQSIPELVKYYMNNTIEIKVESESTELEVKNIRLDVPFKEALTRSLIVGVAIVKQNSNDEFGLEKGNIVFIEAKKDEYWLIHKEKGVSTYVKRTYLEEV